MLSYLFWIDHSFARSKLLEMAFAVQSELKLYTLPNWNDLEFRYLELMPICVVINESELLIMSEENKNFLHSNKVKIIRVKNANDTKEFNSEMVEVIGEISYQLNAMSVVHQIKEIIKAARLMP